jgi:anti-sigma factor RsiW
MAQAAVDTANGGACKMTCDEARLLLMAYHDDELSPADHLRVTRHLETCAACTADHAEAQTLSRLLRDPDLSAQPSEALAARIRFAIRQQAKPRQWVWPAAAAAALIAGIMLYRPVPAEPLLAEVIDSHVRSLQPGHLIDVPSSDRHTVKPWFQGKLDFSPPVPDLSARGWTLIGGRLDYIDHHTAAALVYQRGKHECNVYLWPNASGQVSGLREFVSHGYEALHGSSPSMNYWIVSDLNISELREFARNWE